MTNRTHGKPRRKPRRNGTGSVAINISVPQLLYIELDKIVIRLGYSGPSDYIQNRIRLDAGLVLANEQAIR